MSDIKSNWKLTWDYEGWRKASLADSAYTQKDWNQTLITKINQISAHINKSSLRGGATKIKVNPFIFKIIEDLEYYNEITNKIYGRYYVEVETLLNDVIYVYRDPDPYFVPTLKKGESVVYDDRVETELIDIVFKPYSASTEAEITEYKANMVGKIKILNYES